MPMSVTNTSAPGRAYIDIRVGECQVHQVKLDVSGLTSADDADGYLPPGLPITTAGIPVAAGTDVIAGLIGPEPVKIGSDDIFGNIFLSGTFNRDAIEDNLGRAVSANELAAIALVGAIRLI